MRRHFKHILRVLMENSFGVFPCRQAYSVLSFPSAVTINSAPAVCFAELTRHIKALELNNEVSPLHPEDAIVLRLLVIKHVPVTSVPLWRVIAPVAGPLSFTVRVSKLDKFDAIDFLHLYKTVSMALHNTLGRRRFVTILVRWTAGTE